MPFQKEKGNCPNNNDDNNNNNNNNRAQQKLELQLALWAGKSQNLLAQANFPLGSLCLKKFLMSINNSWRMDKDLTECLMSGYSPSVERFGRSFKFTILLLIS